MPVTRISSFYHKAARIQAAHEDITIKRLMEKALSLYLKSIQEEEDNANDTSVFDASSMDKNRTEVKKIVV